MDAKRRLYRLEPRPLDTGGQADVFVATHKETGARVAFKRVRDPDSGSLARMRREIEVQRALVHPHIMPVFDYADDGSWYTMPLADAILAVLPRPLSDEVLAAIVGQCVAGLAAAHAAGYVHRDITPRNIMRLSTSEQPRWVVADWGAVRRPRGATTVLRTRAGQQFGTEGFAAPESWVDAHGMDWRADVYSLGRVVAWAATGQEPVPNVPLVPPGRWRRFVEATAAPRQDDRPRRVEDVAALLRAATVGLSLPFPAVAPTAMGGAVQRVGVPPVSSGRVAYIGLDGHLHVLDLVSGADTTFLTVGRPYSPRWSPTGSEIVYGEGLAGKDRRTQVAILNPATGRSRILVAPEVRFGDALHPPVQYWAYRFMRWTPDGGAIVYKKDSGACFGHAYMRVPARGGRPEELAGSSYGFFSSTSEFDISLADGRMVLTESGLDHHMGSGGLAVAALDGRDARPLRSFGGAYYFQPVWTPDGREIAVVQGSGAEDGWVLTLVDPATDSQRVLGPVSKGSGYAFAPGGGWLVLSDGATHQLSLINLADFDERHPVGYGVMPTWGPGGRGE